MEGEKQNQVITEKQIVVFNLGNEEFGVDIGEVREIIKMTDITKIPNTESYVDGVINLRGSIIAIIDIEQKMLIPKSEKGKNTRIIVIEIGGDNVGVIVDSCNEVLRLSRDKIEQAPKVITQKINEDYLEGVGILDERLILLLDLTKVIGEETIHHMKKIKTEYEDKMKIEE